MTKTINKMLSIVLSLAIVLTGFIFLGGAVAVNAADKPELIGVEIDEDVSGSGASQPAEDGVYAWYVSADYYADFEESGVTSADFTLQTKHPGDEDWTGAPEGASLTFVIDDSSGEYYAGTVTATIPGNNDAVAKQWRFVYAGGFATGVECPVITQAAAEPDAPAWTASDFTTSGAAVTGLSASGQEKIQVNPVVTFPDDSSLTTINAFLGNSTASRANKDVTGVIIPNNYTTIANNAFKGCSNLTAATLGSGITSIGAAAFMQTGLTSVVIPGSVESLGINAFNNNPLTSVVLNEGLKTINNATFGNTNIASVNLPSTVEALPANAFGSKAKDARTVIIPAEGANYGNGVVRAGTGHVFDGYVLDIALDANGGDAVSPSTVKADKTSTLWSFQDLPIPTKTGSVFVGWFTDPDNGEEVTASTVFDEACTLYAHWVNEYTVTFDKNAEDATVAPASATTDKECKVELPTPQRAGWIFKGWFTDPEDGEQVDSNTVYDEDTTIYAHWDAHYVISFDAVIDGATVDPATAETDDYGKLASLPEPVAEDEEMLFVGWYMYDEAADKDVKVTKDTVFTEDTDVYAQWTTVYWGPDDFIFGNWQFVDDLYIDGVKLETELWAVTGLQDSAKAKLAAGYTDVVIPAEDSDNKQVQGVNASFENMGVTSVEFPSDVYAEDKTRGDFFIGGNTFANNNITKLTIPEGVIFLGYRAFANNKLESVEFPKTLMTISSQTFNGNSTLAKASFPENSSNLGIGSMAFSLCAFTAVQLPKNTVMLSNSAFLNNRTIVDVYIDGKGAGGNIQENTSNSHRVINGALESTVTLDACGGEVEPATLTVKYGKLDGYLDDPYKDGNVFLGWFDATEDGNRVFDDDVFPAEDITLYAHWSDNADMVEAQEKLYESFDAAEAAEDALAAANAAAKTPGDAAVNAAIAAQQKAKAAADKAQEAMTAAESALAAMIEAGKTEGDPEYDAAESLVANAEGMVDYAGGILAEANSAVSKAQEAKAAVDSAAAEAARQGTPDPALPKVTSKKGAAKKTSVTVKWKKLSKKNRKKAEKIEIWVCPDKNFAAANTKTKVVSKKKASAKVGGLTKKTTYYAKVRTIKTVNGVKHVGKWSKVKKIKTKK